MKKIKQIIFRFIFQLSEGINCIRFLIFNCRKPFGVEGEAKKAEKSAAPDTDGMEDISSDSSSATSKFSHLNSSSGDENDKSQGWYIITSFSIIFLNCTEKTILYLICCLIY